MFTVHWKYLLSRWYPPDMCWLLISFGRVLRGSAFSSTATLGNPTWNDKSVKNIKMTRCVEKTSKVILSFSLGEYLSNLWMFHWHCVTIPKGALVLGTFPPFLVSSSSKQSDMTLPSLRWKPESDWSCRWKCLSAWTSSWNQMIFQGNPAPQVSVSEW